MGGDGVAQVGALPRPCWALLGLPSTPDSEASRHSAALPSHVDPFSRTAGVLVIRGRHNPQLVFSPSSNHASKASSSPQRQHLERQIGQRCSQRSPHDPRRHRPPPPLPLSRLPATAMSGAEFVRECSCYPWLRPKSAADTLFPACSNHCKCRPAGKGAWPWPQPRQARPRRCRTSPSG